MDKVDKPIDNRAHTFLEEAASVMKQRATLRDQPEGERSMAAIVRTFNALTNKGLTEAEGWEFMILLKMVRGRQGNYNRDDYVDMSAYSALLGECEGGPHRGENTVALSPATRDGSGRVGHGAGSGGHGAGSGG